MYSILDPTASSHSLPVLARKCFNLMETEGVQVDGKYIMILELLIAVYQMLGNINITVRYGRINGAVLTGNMRYSKVPALKRHVRDLLSLR